MLGSISFSPTTSQRWGCFNIASSNIHKISFYEFTRKSHLIIRSLVPLCYETTRKTEEDTERAKKIIHTIKSKIQATDLNESEPDIVKFDGQ